METVGNILCELPNKPEKYVVIMYRGNKIMSGFTDIVTWATTRFIRECKATKEEGIELGRKTYYIISYEMVGIEYHDHIIYFGSLESLRRTLGYYLLECKVDSTPIMKNDPTYLCVITIKDGELDKWKNSLLK